MSTPSILFRTVYLASSALVGAFNQARRADDRTSSTSVGQRSGFVIVGESLTQLVRKTTLSSKGRQGKVVDIKALVRRLERSNWRERVEAARELGRIGEVAKLGVSALIKALAVPALIKALKDKVGDVRKRVAETLSEIGPLAVAAVPALTEALKDDIGDVAYWAADALGSIGPAARRAVPALVKALGKQYCWLRMAAAEALGEIGAAAWPAIPRLVLKIIIDDDSDVRENSREALKKIVGKILGLKIASKNQ